MRLCIFVFFLLMVTPSSLAQDQFLIVHVKHPASENYKAFMSGIYKDMGIDVQFAEMPIKRRLTILAQGLADANLAGRDGLEALYPNVRKVPIELSRVKGYLVCPENTPCDLQVFRDTNIEVFMDESDKLVFLDNLPFEVGASINLLEDDEILVNMFNAGRVDYIITMEINDGPSLNISRKHHKVETLDVGVYHYVHARHEHLIPELSRLIEINLARLKAR